MYKLAKVRAAIERLHEESRNKKGALYYRKALRTVLFIIDSFQKEPVSEDLRDAANDYVVNIRKGYPRVMDETDKYIYNAFEAGANWQKEMLMAKAVEGVVAFDFYGIDDKSYGCIVHDPICLDDIGAKDTDKVKVIVIKED